jgi:hypothetical protein
VKRLGNLPLAIDQAGAYLQASMKPLKSYIPLFEQNFKFVSTRKPPNAVWQYRDETVFTTWEISFAAIKDKHEEAATLLLLCSFLANEDITEEFIQRGLRPIPSKVLH